MTEQKDFTYWECPECGFDVVHRAGEYAGISCTICAGDSGHDVSMRSRIACDADTPEGRDKRLEPIT